MRNLGRILLIACVVSPSAGTVGLSAPDAAADAGPQLRRMRDFAVIFNLGYAADRLPQDREAFDQLIQAVKRADYNVVLCGVFRDDQLRDVLYLANHNAYQTQNVRLRFAAGPESVSHFDRRSGEWQDLPLEKATVEFDVPPAGGELLRVQRN